MKTHFFLKALAEGDPDGCGRKVQMDFDVDFGFSTDDEEQTCEDLATCFSNFLHSLGYEGSFRYRPFSVEGVAAAREEYFKASIIPDGNPSTAISEGRMKISIYNPDDDDEK